MIAGMIPTAISLTGDNSWRAPMGITVIGGLALSTVLTLLSVPATFSLAVGVERWIGPKLGRRLLPYSPGDDEPASNHPHGRPALPDRRGALGSRGDVADKIRRPAGEEQRLKQF